MSSTIYEAFEIKSLENDIRERQNIIDRFSRTGKLDRNDAISKIKKLRNTDEEVRKVTEVNLMVSSVPFEWSTDEQLANELAMQVSILAGKLAEKKKGDLNHANA